MRAQLVALVIALVCVLASSVEAGLVTEYYYKSTSSCTYTSTGNTTNRVVSYYSTGYCRTFTNRGTNLKYKIYFTCNKSLSSAQLKYKIYSYSDTSCSGSYLYSYQATLGTCYIDSQSTSNTRKWYCSSAGSIAYIAVAAVVAILSVVALF